MALKLRKHPSKQVLLAYAENLVDQSAAIDRSVAAHLSACPQCKAEVCAIQESLSFVSSAPALEPAAEMTARIVMAAKSTRSEMRRRATPLRVILRTVQVGACAAAMLVVTGLTFSAFLSSPDAETATPVFEPSVPAVAHQGASPEAMRQAAVKAAAEVRTLSEAVAGTRNEAPTPEALEEMRVVQSRDTDIAAAISALERNPNNVRATHVVHATLKQQAESLRNIYVEGGSL